MKPTPYVFTMFVFSQLLRGWDSLINTLSEPKEARGFTSSVSLLCPLFPVPVVAGLLCSFLVSLLHTGDHTGPRGHQGPPLPAQEMGRSPCQEGAWRERSGGVVA